MISWKEGPHSRSIKIYLQYFGLFKFQSEVPMHKQIKEIRSYQRVGQQLVDSPPTVGQLSADALADTLVGSDSLPLAMYVILNTQKSHVMS